MKYTRLIVCGDSYSEGMSDEIINGQYRGWADRIADVMTQEVDGFTYVNLAVRGKLLNQVIEDQLPHAISLVTGPETLLSFHLVQTMRYGRVTNQKLLSVYMRQRYVAPRQLAQQLCYLQY